METDARAAEDEGGAARDADRGRPQYRTARAEAAAESQERSRLRADHLLTRTIVLETGARALPRRASMLQINC